MRIFDFLFKKKAVEYVKFCDSFGNFTVDYPKDWKYDPDIAVVEGQYTNSFSNGRANFTIAVNAMIPENFNFDSYAKDELEGAGSGIYAKPKKSAYLGMPAYTREYEYNSGGRKFFGGGVMFFTGKLVFSITWNAPEGEKKEMKAIFDRMLGSLVIGKHMGVGG